MVDIKITELKTLNDIDSYSCWDDLKRDEEYFSLSSLKQEVIKHIKHIQKGLDQLRKEHPKDFTKRIDYAFDLGQITSLIDFFNITKKDLK